MNESDRSPGRVPPPKTCALCDVQLGDQNDSHEHIIPQSIGGRRTVRRFICKPCNDKTGATWDTELFKQFHWLTVMLGTSRESGPAKPIRVDTVSGTTYAVRPNGDISHLNPTVVPNADGNSYRIEARSVDDAKQQLKQLKRRYPALDIEQALSTAIASSRPVNEVFKTSFEFGGEYAGRSMVKSALALAYSLGVQPVACELAMPFLRYAECAPDCLAEHFDCELVRSRPTRLFNCVAVHGDGQTRRLLGYIEYFGVCRWVVHMSKEYDGPDIRGVYCIDGITGEAVPLDVDLTMSDEGFQASLEGRTRDTERWLAAVNAAMLLVRQRRSELSRAANVDFAISAACAAMGVRPDDPLDDEQQQEFLGRVERMLVDGLVPR